MDWVKAGVSAVQGATQEIQRRYEQATQELKQTRHSFNPASPVGAMDTAGQMLRDWNNEAVAGGVVGAARTFGADVTATLLQTPGAMAESTADTVLPGGFATWEGREILASDRDYAPNRFFQAQNMRRALDANASVVERAEAFTNAVAATPMVVVESMTWTAGARAAEAMGESRHRADEAWGRGDYVGWALSFAQSEGEFAQAIASFGVLAAPLSSRPRPVGDAAWKTKISGSAQKTKTPGHQFRIYREAIAEAKKPDVASVHLDHGYNRGLSLDPKEIAPNRRPDVLSVYEDRSVARVEVQSKTDVPAVLRSRNAALDAQLKARGFKPTPPRVVRPH